MMRATVGEYVRCESGVDVASPGVMVDGREVDAVDMGVVVVVFAGAADVCGVEDVVDAAGADGALCSACSAGPGDVVCETEVDGTAILAGVAGVCVGRRPQVWLKYLEQQLKPLLQRQPSQA